MSPFRFLPRFGGPPHGRALSPPPPPGRPSGPQDSAGPPGAGLLRRNSHVLTGAVLIASGRSASFCVTLPRCAAGIRPVTRPSHGPGPILAHITVTTAAALTATLDAPLLFAGRPHITGLVPLPATDTGPCQSTPRGALRHCPRTGAAFGVRGQGLLGLRASRVRAGPHECPAVTVVNASYLTCAGLRGSGHSLAVQVTTNGATSLAAPALTLSFADPCHGKAGHWEGDACAQCRAGYYGAGCAAACPGVAEGRACGGHGRCDDGARGTGRCLCYADVERGHWAGERCGECRGGWYGDQCRRQCPTADPEGTGVASVRVRVGQ